MIAHTNPQQRSTVPLTFMPGPALLLQRKCACGESSDLTGSCSDCGKKKLVGQPLQRKLRINEPGDRYEQEADRVADQVMRMAEPASESDASKFSRSALVQRNVGANAAGPAAAPAIVQDVVSSPGEPLDAGTRAFFEPRFGHDFSRVRVHSDRHAAESARAVNALAYTVGPDVAFGAGQYRVNSTEGRRLLAHELTHVVQQSAAGSYRASSLQRKAAFVNGSISETLNLADRVLHGQSAGATDFVLNGSTFTTVNDGVKALHVPRLGSSARGRRTRCWFASVPDNEVSFAMRILSPDPWSAATTKAALGNLLPGLSAACSGADPATFTVNGSPKNQDQRDRTRAHEQRHADDYQVILNDIIAPWDKAVTEARAKRKAVVDADKDQCSAKLYGEAVGQNQRPEDIVTAVIKTINEKADLFHNSAAGRNVRLANPATDRNCNTVTAEAH
jgi:hypothetical protein